MNLEAITRRWTLTAALCGAALTLTHCGASHEVELPRVTEESLSPEQKAQFDRMRSMQADVLKQAGGPEGLALTPEEVARQRFEAQQNRPGENSGTPAGNAN